MREGVERFLSGEVETGRAILRDYINATVGFPELGRLTGKTPKSLMRMFGPGGNPQARNLFEVIELLQKQEGLRFQLTVKRAPRNLSTTLRHLPMEISVGLPRLPPAQPAG